MYNLYFKKPKYPAKIKINGKIITQFPFNLELENEAFIEFLPANNVNLPFFTTIYCENDKLLCTNNLTLYKFNNLVYLVEFCPNLVSLPLEKLATVKCEFIYDLYSFINYILFVKNKEKIVKIIKLNNDISSPKIDTLNGYIIVKAKCFNMQYLMVIDKTATVIINNYYNDIKIDKNCVVLSKDYCDSLSRVATYTYNTAFVLDNIKFTYKKSSSNLPLLFIEAYLSKDFIRIKEIVCFDVNIASIINYLGDFEFLQQFNNDIYILKDSKICKITFTIKDNLITCFELIYPAI